MNNAPLFINDQKTPITISTTTNFKEWIKGLSDETSPLVCKGILLKYCKEIQMRTCSIPLDIVFVNRRGFVVKLHKNVQPKASNRFSWRAWHCFELPVGTIDQYDLKAGSKLQLSVL
jgi:uncharacterized membrane protein (UPF0127 family)